jgi:hypothetical protein
MTITHEVRTGIAGEAVVYSGVVAASRGSARDRRQRAERAGAEVVVIDADGQVHTGIRII